MASGVTLTINSGVVVKPQATSSGILVNGTLNATGAIFTSFKDDSFGGDTNGDGSATSPAPGDWKWIYFGTGGSGTISNCTITYGGWGGYYYSSNIYITSASPSITGTTITNSLGNGVYVNSGSPSVTASTISNNGSGGASYYGVYAATAFAAFNSNSLTGNSGVAVMLPATLGTGTVYGNTYSGNQKNAMFLAGDVTQNSDWPASNSPYVLTGSTTILNGRTLTIDSGVVVKPQTTNPFVVYGTLNATGAVLTSFKDDSYGGDTNGDGSATSPAPGDWKWIYFGSGGGGTISNCLITYGGWGGNYYNGNIYIVSSSPTITGTAISKSLGNGIYVYSGSPSIHYNDIFANATYGISTNGVGLDATHNYWGSKHGPKPYGSGNGFSGPVTAVPWSRVPFTAAGAAYQATLGMADYCAICGDPINTATGAFVYQHEDIKIATRGLPLEFQRTYNSNDASDGDLGFGWSHSWQISASPLANGNVIMLRGDGRQDLFTLNPDSSYSPPPGRHDVLTKNPDGTYKLITQEQITYNFNSANSLASEISETGQTTSFTYDTNQRLTTITEPAGRTLTFAYNTANRISQITDPAGGHVSYAYSAASDLTSVTDQNGSVTTFTYDAYHHITSVTDPNGHASANNTYDAQGRVVSQTDADGRLLSFAYDDPNRKTTMTRQMDPNDPSKDEVTSFYYDSLYRLTRETDSYGKDTLYNYDSAGNRDTVTDRRGTVTKQVYDAYGNITDIYKAFGLPEEEHTHYTYNANNHPLSKTDPRGETTSYTYDASGTFLTEVSYPQVTNYDNTVSNYTESFTYNPDGTRATHTDPDGDVTSFSYDANGYLSSETRNTNRPAADQVTIGYVFDPLGRKTQETDGNGHVTDFQYDNLGNLRFITGHVTDPGTGLLTDVTTEYQYDAAGNKVKMIDPEGKITTYDYTPMNRLSQVTDAALNTVQYTYDAAGNKTAVKDRNGNWTFFGFDKNNRMFYSKDPENNITNYAYDEEGNQTSVTDPLGNSTTMTYDALGRMTSRNEPDEGGVVRTTSYAYDAADHLVSTTDPLNHTTTAVYDELGRQKQATDALGSSAYYAYDGVGNLVKMKDQNGHETIYGYTPNDFLASVTDAGGGLTSYGYDKAGNRTSQTDANNHTTLYSYDELNRLTEEKVDAGGGNYLLDRSYTYDKAGHQLTDTTGSGTSTDTYDSVYNLTGVTDRQGATYSFTYDANQNQLTATDNTSGKTVSFNYSPRGELAQSTDAFGATENFTYDALGNLSQRQDTVALQNFTTTYDYTPRNQLKGVTRGSDTTAYSFDAGGNLASKSYPNGDITTYSYNADNRLTASQATYGGQNIQSFSQTYDPDGNVTSLTDANGTTSYSYDSLSRLTAENISGYGTIAYAYDPAGNRTTLDHPTIGHTDYSYNEANQLTSSLNNGTTTTYSYDANGALSQKVSGGGTTSYTYNGLDKLTQVTTPTATVNYAYDALGRRISRADGSTTSNYSLSGKEDLADYDTDAAGNLTGAYLRGADGLISQTDYTGQTPVTSYDLYNPHGDTSALADQSGAIAQSFRYDSFGNELSSASPRYGYTGKWQRDLDSATGTIRMGVREYDPSLGRFISADPLAGDPANPQQRNRYPYVGNNPQTRYDLSGKNWLDDFLNWMGKPLFGPDVNNDSNSAPPSEEDQATAYFDSRGCRVGGNEHSAPFSFHGFYYQMSEDGKYIIGLPNGRSLVASLEDPYLRIFVSDLKSFQDMINIAGFEGIINAAESVDPTSWFQTLMDARGVAEDTKTVLEESVLRLYRDYNQTKRWEETCSGSHVVYSAPNPYPGGY